MNEQTSLSSLSTGQRIASLRHFFRARRGDGQTPGARAGAGDGWKPTLWPETEWGDTQLELPGAELG